MDERFIAHVESLRPSFQRLIAMTPVTYSTLPRQMPKRGIYLFSENERHLYIGRSNHIRKRLGRHCRPSAHANMASFAFQLAREATNRRVASYQRGSGGTRKELMADPVFAKAFAGAKTGIRTLQIRFVEEADPTRQALLEIYAAVVLGTPYNDFDTH